MVRPSKYPKFYTTMISGLKKKNLRQKERKYCKNLYRKKLPQFLNNTFDRKF